jgi:uncharacterized NAD-dependent epimerase/dehydratase family protein
MDIAQAENIFVQKPVLSVVQKESPSPHTEEEKQLIDLLSAIIVDTVLNKSSYDEKEMHQLPAL